jgi:hypothetical protein
METSRRVAKPPLWWKLARVRRSSLNEGEARGYRLRFVSAPQCSLMSLFGKQLCGCPEKNLRRHPGTSFARGWAGCSPAKYSRLLNAGVVACTGLSWRHVLFTRSCRCIHTVHRPRKATFPVLVGFSGDAAMTTTTWLGRAFVAPSLRGPHAR